MSRTSRVSRASRAFRALVASGAVLALAGIAAGYAAAQTTSAPAAATKPLAPVAFSVYTLTVLPAKAAHGDPCSTTAAACISLSKQEAWFVRNGKIIRGPVRVATGRAGYGTEVGTFKVWRKNRMWYSTIYNNAPMPYSVFFDGGEAFHEGSVYERSHGCVHLSASNASWVFNFLHIGDKVQVVY